MGIKERKEREKRLRREKIQKAASELFAEKGFRSTTMEDIAERSEWSPATIYQHFKNKDELYASLNIRYQRYLLAQLKRISNNGKLPPEQKMKKYKTALYNSFKKYPLYLRNILHLQTEDTFSKLSQELVDEIYDLSAKVLATLSETYQEGVRQGVFEKGHGIAHADIIWGMFSGIALWLYAKKKANPEKDFFQSTLDQAFEIFCKGIKSN